MNLKMLRGAACRFFADEDGSTAMEYSLIAALIGIAIIASVQAVSQSNENNFGAVEEALVEE